MGGGTLRVGYSKRSAKLANKQIGGSLRKKKRHKEVKSKIRKETFATDLPEKKIYIHIYIYMRVLWRATHWKTGKSKWNG